SCPRLSIRGHGGTGLEIPFGLEAPVEGASLSLWDATPCPNRRRPSPGFRRVRPTPSGASATYKPDRAARCAAPSASPWVGWLSTGLSRGDRGQDGARCS